MNKNAFDISFRHRINASVNGDFINAIDAINPSLERALAIADLIEVACEVTTPESFEENTLWRAAQVIRLEIMDAKILLNACVESENSTIQK